MIPIKMRMSETQSLMFNRAYNRHYKQQIDKPWLFQRRMLVELGVEVIFSRKLGIGDTIFIHPLALGYWRAELDQISQPWRIAKQGGRSLRVLIAKFDSLISESPVEIQAGCCERCVRDQINNGELFEETNFIEHEDTGSYYWQEKGELWAVPMQIVHGTNEPIMADATVVTDPISQEFYSEMIERCNRTYPNQ